MSGRRKHPNSPNATHAVRISERAFEKLLKQQNGREPFGWTLERAISKAELIENIESEKEEFDYENAALRDTNERLQKRIEALEVINK